MGKGAQKARLYFADRKDMVLGIAGGILQLADLCDMIERRLTGVDPVLLFRAPYRLKKKCKS